MERIEKSIEKLTDTPGHFLKRITDVEMEFEIMKADINKLKKIISEKLFVKL